MIPTNFYHLNAEQQRKIITKLDLDHCIKLKKDGLIQTEKARGRLNDRIHTLLSTERLKQERERKFDKFLELLDKGWYKVKAGKKVGLDRKVYQKMLAESGYEYCNKRAYIVTDLDENKMIDRLHYHKWDATLNINDEMFYKFEEEA